VLELLESGELAKLKTTWWLEKGKCDKEGSPKKVSPERSVRRFIGFYATIQHAVNISGQNTTF